MPERTKQTRLEELDLRAKSLLEAWNKDTFGPQQQSAAGANDSGQPFRKFSAGHHKRGGPEGHAKKLYEEFNLEDGSREIRQVGTEWIETWAGATGEGPPTLEERWDSSAFKGGPANEAKGGGSSTTNVSAKLTSPRRYEGEQNGELTIKFLDQDFFVPDSPFNRDIWEKFKVTYASGKPDEDGKAAYDYFFQLADVVGAPAFGNATIRAHWEKFFGDGNPPSIQATKIIRRNQWSQQDLKVQYDEGRDYRYTDSYYRYDVATPDLEFGNADDPQTKQNHQSFTLKRTDDNTIELRKNIHRATEINPAGEQWPNKTEHGSSTFTRSNSYDHRMKTSFIRTKKGIVQYHNIVPTALAWPEVSSIPPNKTPFGDNRSAKNLEELWFSLIKIKTAGPRSDQVQRPGTDSRLSTIFSANNISAADYKVRFLGALNGSFANVPGKDAVTYQGLKGFNVGQVAPYNDFGSYVFGDKREMDMYDSGILHRILSKINTYEQNLMEIKPGGNRINIVFNIRLNLDRLLQQNLLMPSDIHPIDQDVGRTYGIDRADDLVTAIEEGKSSHIDDSTFVKLYLDNRSALHAADREGFARTPPGTIAGVPVASLQGPPSYQGGSVAAGTNVTSDEDDNFPVFTFEEDYKRNNPITKDRGFIDNISGQVHGNRSGIGGLMPAVENDPGNDFPDETSFLKTRGRANEQFFPFMFETVNKKGSSIGGGPEFKQYAYFQATLQSLNESYAPAWSSKHFFGRTEQIHTYTMTDRTIDLSFVIFATEIRRLQNLYERVSWLAQQTYPSYDSSSRLKSGPLIRMTIGDMFSNLTGFIRSLSFDWNYLGPGGKWEITQGLRIPMACTVAMNFTVMHDDMPDRNYNFYPGMLLGGSGLIGNRGRTKLLPNGGPLIATAERVADSDELPTPAQTYGMTPERYAELVAAAGLRKARKQQYIDWLDNNTSMGRYEEFAGQNYNVTAGVPDLVF